MKRKSTRRSTTTATLAIRLPDSSCSVKCVLLFIVLFSIPIIFCQKGTRLEYPHVPRQITLDVEANFYKHIYDARHRQFDSAALKKMARKMTVGAPYPIASLINLQPGQVTRNAEIAGLLEKNPMWVIPIMFEYRPFCKLYYAYSYYADTDSGRYSCAVGSPVWPDSLHNYEIEIVWAAILHKREVPVFVEFLPSFLVYPIRFFFFKSAGSKSLQFVSDYRKKMFSGDDYGTVLDSVRNSLFLDSVRSDKSFQCHGKFKPLKIINNEFSSIKELFIKYKLHIMPGKPTIRSIVIDTIKPNGKNFYIQLCNASHRIGICPEGAVGDTVRMFKYRLQEHAWNNDTAYGIAYILDSAIIGATYGLDGCWVGGPVPLDERSVIRPKRFKFPDVIPQDIDSVLFMGPWDKTNQHRCWIHTIVIKRKNEIHEFARLLAGCTKAAGGKSTTVFDQIIEYRLCIRFNNGGLFGVDYLIEDGNPVIPYGNDLHYRVSEGLSDFLFSRMPRK
ncbi:MAG: hypothetical protein JXA18_11825 [Chitinispirillaceae bacterium]|nr:hypothetical protein [Chitinispirillaceae bacterium]